MVGQVGGLNLGCCSDQTHSTPKGQNDQKRIYEYFCCSDQTHSTPENQNDETEIFKDFKHGENSVENNLMNSFALQRP